MLVLTAKCTSNCTAMTYILLPGLCIRDLS